MLTIAAALPAWAATVTWNVAGSGDWDTTTGNWTGGSPTDNLYVEGDAAVFSNTAGGLITITSSVSPGSTTVSAASGSYTFQTGGIATGTLAKSGAARYPSKRQHLYWRYHHHFRQLRVV